MKFVSFKTKTDEERLGLFVNDKIYDLQENARMMNTVLPSTMNELLWGGEKMMDEARRLEEEIKKGTVDLTVQDSTPLAPVPHPTSCRDAYAFRQHVAAARRNRGVDMIPEFDQFPIFYFTNHNGILGEGDCLVETDHLLKLDFELEAAVVIGKKGRNVAAAEADSYVAGYTIMNDFSARQLQMEEMKLNLGPAKGKDFATAIGPWMVTPDELTDKLVTTDAGNQYDLRMTAKHNGELISDGNMKDMTYTFAEIIERCAYGVDIFPGDVIGSGTVGTGCYLELNGTRRREAEEKGESYDPVWLEDGDTIELEIERLGVLTNKIVKASKDYSILARKKNVQ
ncbi:fumarylacetoacetate hydrolase family protein [candidate division GN15 bacterium]|nr:fumarylacetoacetate hydrolase family protein [candidate division GN15 bacterium]